MSHTALATDLPVLRHHLPSALVAAGASVALALAPRSFGTTGLVVVVAVLQLLLILSWSQATGARGYVGLLMIGAAAAVAADLELAMQDELALAPFALILAGALLAGFVHQIVRRPPRRRATSSLAGVGVLVMVVVALSTFLPLYRYTEGSELYLGSVAAAGGAVVVGHLVDLVLPYPRLTPGVPRGLLGLLAGIGAGVAAALVIPRATGLIEGLGGAIGGAILGLVAALLAVAASYIAAERPQRAVALSCVQALLPLAASAPVAYFLSQRALG